MQEDVIKATSLVISPNNNTTPELKLRFQWDSLDHIKLSDICLAFKLRIYKSGQNERVPTAFNMTAGHADATLMKKFCLREDFIFYLIKGLKLFTNEARNQEHCSNKYVVSEYLSRMKAMTYKKNYGKTYREKNLDYQLGTIGFGVDSFVDFYANHPTLDESKSTNANIRVIDTARSPKYQTVLCDRYNAKACGNGVNFLVPLKLLSEIFEIGEYIGRGKKFALELCLENNYNKLLEHIFPIAQDQINGLSNIFIKMEDPRLLVQMYKINSTLVVEKTSLMMANPDKPYTMFRMQHLELIDSNSGRQKRIDDRNGQHQSVELVGEYHHHFLLSKKSIETSKQKLHDDERYGYGCSARSDFWKLQTKLLQQCRRYHHF